MLASVIAAVERKADREARRWHCPGGCAFGDPTCARATFRLQCVPVWRSNDEWDSQPLSREERWDGHKAAHTVTEDMRQDFLETWDGMIESELHWEPPSVRAVHSKRERVEYRGASGQWEERP